MDFEYKAMSTKNSKQETEKNKRYTTIENMLEIGITP
jgi:hypothetical protein